MCENVNGAFQVIIGGCRQWVEWGKCNMMIEDKYMVEVTGLVCLCVCDAGENKKCVYLWQQIGTVSMHGNGEWKSVRV